MLVSEQNNFLSCFVGGSITEAILWFMVEKTIIDGIEIGRRKISPCTDEVALPEHGELILVMRMSGEVLRTLAPVNIGGAATRRHFRRLCISSAPSTQFGNQNMGSDLYRGFRPFGKTYALGWNLAWRTAVRLDTDNM
ncbi:hypothetical protein M8J77_015410 [Diaphorina citri]|nr:hypothetical protein M8J77_015410 [Diaphorina citri]